MTIATTKTPGPERKSRRRMLLGTAAAAVGAIPFSSLSQPVDTPMPLDAKPTRKNITLINIFSVAPDNRDRLARLLQEGTDSWISKIPGFIASTLYLSRDDGNRIVIHGQWQSAEAIAAMRQSPEMPAYFERIQALATMEAITCDALSTWAVQA